MRMSQPVFALTLLALVCLGCSHEPKTTEEVLKDIRTKSAKIQAYSADTDTTANMGSMAMQIGGTMQGKEKLMAITMNMSMMGQNIAMKIITDKAGMTSMDMDMMGNKQVMKMDKEQAKEMRKKMMPGMPEGVDGMGGMQNDPRTFTDQFLKSFDMAYTGKEKLGNEDVYVLTGKIKEEFKTALTKNPAMGNAAAMGMDMSSMFNSIRVKIGVKDGFPRSTEMLGKDDKPWMTQMFKNVKINPSMEDAVFDYTPAAGVQVMDMSEMAGTALQNQGAAPAPGATPQN